MQFPNINDVTYQSDVSNLNLSNESSKLDGTKRKSKDDLHNIFGEVKYSKKVAYPDTIKNFFNPRMDENL